MANIISLQGNRIEKEQRGHGLGMGQIDIHYQIILAAQFTLHRSFET